MYLLDRFPEVFHAFMDTAPGLVVHDQRLYLLIAAGVFITIWFFDMFVVRYMTRALVRGIERQYLGTNQPGKWQVNWASIFINTTFQVGYCVTIYFEQLGLTLALFGILAALDIFTDRFTVGDPDGSKPLPSQAQASLVQLSIALDALWLIVYGSATLLFQHFVVLR